MRTELDKGVVGEGGREEDGEVARRQAGSLWHPMFVGREIVMWGCGINQSKMGLPWGSSSSAATAVLALHTQGWQGASAGS